MYHWIVVLDLGVCTALFTMVQVGVVTGGHHFMSTTFVTISFRLHLYTLHLHFISFSETLLT
jgi:hypothetical protein